MNHFNQGITRRAALAGSLATPMLGSYFSPASAQQAALVELGSNGWLFPIWDRISRVDLVSLRASIQTMAEAVGILRAARIQMAVCLIPSKKRLMRQFLPAGTPVVPEAALRYSLTVSELTRAGALVPDLEALFRTHIEREPGRNLFFKTDSHWTPFGAELAAVEIARQMRERLQLPPSPRQGTRLGDLRPMVMALGDLVPLLPQPQRAAYGPEESLIRQILPPEGASALIEDDSYDTVVVGTSNMQPRFGFQPVLSNQLVRPVGLFWRPNSVGPSFTLLEYLRSDSFKRQRPRAMLWNLLEQDMLFGTNNSAWSTSAIPPTDFLNQLRRSVA